MVDVSLGSSARLHHRQRNEQQSALFRVYCSKCYSTEGSQFNSDGTLHGINPITISSSGSNNSLLRELSFQGRTFSCSTGPSLLPWRVVHMGPKNHNAARTVRCFFAIRNTEALSKGKQLRLECISATHICLQMFSIGPSTHAVVDTIIPAHSPNTTYLSPSACPPDTRSTGSVF